MASKPPKYAEKLLQLFLKEEYKEEVLGDLDEKFHLMISTKSLQKARLNYWFQVMNYLRPFAIKQLRSNSKTTMIKHNILIGIRILLKNKLYSTINIGGLAIGMTISILVGLWIHEEFTFNKNHENYDRIVQVLRKDTEDGLIEVNSSQVSNLGIKLKEEYAHYFEDVTMTFYRPSTWLLKSKDQSIEEIGYFFQSSVNKILTPEIIKGDYQALDNAQGVMLSESLAHRLFGEEDPMDQTVTLNTQVDLIVKGVYKDFPKNSTFAEAKFMASQKLFYKDNNSYTWDNYNMKIYGLLKKGADFQEASLAIKDLLNNELELIDEPMDLLLLAMQDWHLKAYFKDGIQVMSGKMKSIWLYGIVGLLVLLIACINFMNLNTARYQVRAKEVGVRKTIGSFRSNLVAQIYTESMLYSLAALFLSLLAAYLILPWFSGISDKTIDFPFANLWFWLSCVGFTLFSTLIAGSYPALFFASIPAIAAIKGTFKAKSSGVKIRQSLVVFQFTISIILTIGAFVVYQQINYVKDRPVGYNQDHLITMIGRSEDYVNKVDLLRTELKNAGVVIDVAQANYPLTNTLGNNNAFRFDERTIDASFNTIYTNPEYGNTVGWELTAGRNFTRDLDETSSVILSESAAKLIGIKDPIGKILDSKYEFNGKKKFNIVGIVNDMVKGSPYEETMPMIIFCKTEPMRHLFIRINPSVDYFTALSKIQEVYEELIPKEGFNFKFVDGQYLTKFKAEEQVANFITSFCILAILIGCLGLFGLSAFVVNRRIKEIGIRKVMGASMFRLWSLISKDFGLLIILSCFVANPIAIYILTNWLNDYAYRIDLEWWYFGLGNVVCILITLATVSFHSIKASRVNPVNNLRIE